MIKSAAKLLSLAFGNQAGDGKIFHSSPTCPECGSKLGAAAGGEKPVWRCPNPDCPPQVLKRVALWASPEAMDLRGCDDAVVKQLVARGLVRDAAEFYRLKVGEIAALDGMTKERAKQIFDAITASMKHEAWRVLFGLGIPNIGAAEAQVLCRHFATLDALFATGPERLLKLAGVTETMARSLAHWSGDPVNCKLIRRLEKAGLNFKSTIAAG